MAGRRYVSARTPWEDSFSYSRAVKVGRVIAISGTAASDEKGKIAGKGDAYSQTLFIIKKIEAALKELDSSLNDVIRTRIFITDMAQWSEIARAHNKYFASVKPATTIVQVDRFIHPEMLVEIEAEAIS